jgi:hypothetical protein
VREKTQHFYRPESSFPGKTMGLDLKNLLISCLFSSLSFWALGTETGNNKVLELKVLHPHGEYNIMDFIQADETVAPATTEAPSGSGSAAAQNSTSSQECDRNANCCYQYTWPGPRYDDGNTNFTCAQHDRISKEPCRSPMVFTYQNSTEQIRRRPNITDLVKFTDDNNYRIYCVKSNACIKYTYYEDGNDGKQIRNETRFCGAVTRVNNGGSVQKGCYEEKVGGYTRELCVCNSDRCNTSTKFAPHPLALLLAAMILIRFQRRH